MAFSFYFCMCETGYLKQTSDRRWRKSCGKKTKCIQMDILIYQMSQGWFCSLWKKKASARICTHVSWIFLSQRISPCTALDYVQRTVCALKSVCMCLFVLGLLICPRFFPRMNSPWLSPLYLKNCSCKNTANEKQHARIYTLHPSDKLHRVLDRFAAVFITASVIKLQMNVLLFSSGFWVIWNFDHKGKIDPYKAP